MWTLENLNKTCSYLQKSGCSSEKIEHFREDVKAGAVSERMKRLFQSFLKAPFNEKCDAYLKHNFSQHPVTDPLHVLQKAGKRAAGLFEMVVRLRVTTKLFAPLNHVAMLSEIGSIRERVHALAIGASLSVPAGWAETSQTGGHFAIQIITCEEEQKYSLTTLNTMANPFNEVTKGKIARSVTEHGISRTLMDAHLLFLRHLSPRLIVGKDFAYLNKSLYRRRGAQGKLWLSKETIPPQTVDDCVQQAVDLFLQI